MTCTFCNGTGRDRNPYGTIVRKQCWECMGFGWDRNVSLPFACEKPDNRCQVCMGSGYQNVITHLCSMCMCLRCERPKVMCIC